MDVNEYMKESLAHQARQTQLLEAILKGINAINEQGVAVVNQVSIAMPEGTDLKAVGNLVHAQPAKQPAAEEKPKPAAEPKQDAKPAPAAEPKAKKVTVDDARAALKKYAAAEGNDAAMELLTSLGAASVSALAEQGPGKLQELIDRCEGKGA